MTTSIRGFGNFVLNLFVQQQLRGILCEERRKHESINKEEKMDERRTRDKITKPVSL